MKIIKMTRPARSLFAKVCECLSEIDRERFTRRLEVVYDQKITGEVELSTYDIEEKDIYDVLEGCSFIDFKRIEKLIRNP